MTKGQSVVFWVGETEAQGVILGWARDPQTPPHGVLIRVLTDAAVTALQQCYWPDGKGGRVEVSAEKVVAYKGHRIVTIGAIL